MLMKWLKQFDGVGRWQLATNMQVMIGTQQILFMTKPNCIEHSTPSTATQAFLIRLADA